MSGGRYPPKPRASTGVTYIPKLGEPNLTAKSMFTLMNGRIIPKPVGVWEDGLDMETIYSRIAEQGINEDYFLDRMPHGSHSIELSRKLREVNALIVNMMAHDPTLQNLSRELGKLLNMPPNDVLSSTTSTTPIDPTCPLVRTGDATQPGGATEPGSPERLPMPDLGYMTPRAQMIPDPYADEANLANTPANTPRDPPTSPMVTRSGVVYNTLGRPMYQEYEDTVYRAFQANDLMVGERRANFYQQIRANGATPEMIFEVDRILANGQSREAQLRALSDIKPPGTPLSPMFGFPLGENSTMEDPTPNVYQDY